jgi:uncharacterized protein YciI
MNDCNFVYVLRLIRPEALRGMTAEEEAIVDEHFGYLKRGLAEGRLGFAGRCLDGEFGIVLFRARSEDEAKRFMENDPAVKKGVMRAELHSFRVALVEKK